MLLVFLRIVAMLQFSSLLSAPLGHSHSAHLGSRLVGSPDPVAAGYLSAHFERPAVAFLQDQIVLHLMLCVVSRATPHLLLLCSRFRSLRERHFPALAVATVVFFLAPGLSSSFCLPFFFFSLLGFTDLYTSFFQSPAFWVWPLAL